MSSKTLTEAEDRMKKALEHVRHELSGIRTGKASPQLLDTVLATLPSLARSVVPNAATASCFSMAATPGRIATPRS